LNDEKLRKIMGNHAIEYAEREHDIRKAVEECCKTFKTIP